MDPHSHAHNTKRWNETRLVGKRAECKRTIDHFMCLYTNIDRHTYTQVYVCYLGQCRWMMCGCHIMLVCDSSGDSIILL